MVSPFFTNGKTGLHRLPEFIVASTAPRPLFDIYRALKIKLKDSSCGTGELRYYYCTRREHAFSFLLLLCSTDLPFSLPF